MRRAIFTISLGLSALVGCGSSPILQSVTDTNQAGLVYALPKAQIQLEAIRKTLSKDDVEAAQKEAAQRKAALEAAQKNLVEANAAAAAAQSEIDALKAGTDDAIRQTIETKLLVAKLMARARAAEVQSAKILSEEAAKRLAETQANLGKLEQTVTLKALAPAPDSERRYVLKMEPKAWRDDSVKLAISNGLLNTTTSESTGQVGAVIVNLVSAIAGAKAGGSTGTKALQASPGATQTTCKPFHFSRTFDPTNSAEVSAVKSALEKESNDSLTVKEPASAAAKAPHAAASGIAYRAPTTVTVEVGPTKNSSCVSDSPSNHASVTAVVPDSTATFWIKVEGSALTKSKVDLGFKDGMPISLSAEQPSQLVAVSRIPIDILKAIVEVPASILKLRVDYDSQAAALVDAQTKQIKAQLDLLKAQQALEDARNAVTPP